MGTQVIYQIPLKVESSGFVEWVDTLVLGDEMLKII